MDYNYVKETSKQLHKQDQVYAEQRYLTSQVYKGLGLTRDTLRYYEELGILAPNKNEENSYREYSIDDIWNIMAIDFYKKRGITPKELKNVITSNKQENYRKLFLDKKVQLEESIKSQKRMLKKLEETIAFNEIVQTELNLFQVRELPLYEVEEEISSFVNFKEYGDKVLKHVDIVEDDIFSNLIRVLMIDDNGYTGTKGYIVKKAKSKANGKQYLESGKALCVIIEDSEDGDECLMDKMFAACTQWAQEHNQKFKGVVYLYPRSISWLDLEVKSYLECWVPIQSEIDSD